MQQLRVKRKNRLFTSLTFECSSTSQSIEEENCSTKVNGTKDKVLPICKSDDISNNASNVTSIDASNDASNDASKVTTNDALNDASNGTLITGNGKRHCRRNSATWPCDVATKDSSSATVFLRLKSGSYRDIAQV